MDIVGYIPKNMRIIFKFVYCKNMSFWLNLFKSNVGDKRFLVVKIFAEEESKIIFRAMKTSQLYFNDSGHIVIKNSDGTITKYMNPIVTDMNKITDVIDSNIASYDSSQAFVYSRPHGAWILHILSETSIQLLYNSIPRDDFAKYYASDPYQAKGLLLQYCKEVNGRDPVCKCLNQETSGDESEKYQFCMNDLLGGNDIRRTIKSQDSAAYGALQQYCSCVNMNCDKNHPIYKVDRTGTNACADSLNITLCSQNISAGGNMSSQGIIALRQSCSASIANANDAPTTDTIIPTIIPTDVTIPTNVEPTEPIVDPTDDSDIEPIVEPIEPISNPIINPIINPVVEPIADSDISSLHLTDFLSYKYSIYIIIAIIFLMVILMLLYLRYGKHAQVKK